MKKKFDIVGSIVLYQNDIKILRKAIHSFFNTSLKVKLFLIDNSPTDALAFLEEVNPNIEYIFNNKNVGFGAGHNIAIKKALDNSEYYLVLNPDVEYEEGNIEKLFSFIEKNSDISLVAPLTLYPDKSLQYLCRLLPTPFDFFIKRLIPSFLLPLFKKRTDEYEFRSRDYNEIMDVPFLSGCFMLIRTTTLQKVGLFDENIFMYTEDIDLCRRINEIGRTVHYPLSKITHVYERGSAKNLKLFFISIRSSIYYFNKWGWFFDNKRKLTNRKCR